MNKHMLTVCLSLIMGGLFIAGCGPENLDSAMMDDTSDKEIYAKKNATPMEDDEDEAPKAMPKVAPKVMAPAVEVTQLPTRHVRLPSRVQAEQPVITNSDERREFAQDVIHESHVHVLQPSINKHNIHRNLTINNKYHTTLFNHPSFRNDITTTSSVSRTDEELPTTVIDSPTTNVVNVGTYYGYGRYCAPWLSGGFHRFCGGAYPHYYRQVVGPYYR